MLKTIKSKILFITLSMLVVIITVFAVFIILVFGNVKELVTRSCDYTVSAFAESVNKDIIQIENNVIDLALLGEVYYMYGRDKDMLEYSVKEIFEGYKPALGGGVWFKPYVLNPYKKYGSLYVFRDSNGLTKIDRIYETASYDYPSKSWYKEITGGIKKELDVWWTKPYFEEEGGDTLMVTAGTGIYDKNRNLVGISTVDWKISSIIKMLSKLHPTPNSFALFADIKNDYVFATTDTHSSQKDAIGKSLKDIEWFNNSLKDESKIIYHNKKYITFVRELENGLYFIVNVPDNELFYLAITHFCILFLILALIAVIINSLLYLILDNNMSKPIDKLIKIANKIRSGELNTEIKLEKPEEFANLASTFDKMAKDIQNITHERDKIELELSLAKTIQASTLPHNFSAYSQNSEFDIYAVMEPAKEVGGDFYDFYFIDDDHFLFLIADVSGKGVPAALFMMTVKTLISNISKIIHNPKDIFENINKQICENNKVLFVTLFACIVNIKNGKMSCVNCGHNPPLIKHNGRYEYLDIDANMVLGAFEDMTFKVYETTLDVGDEIFLYTDGVTEALNKEHEMYGETRLIEALNSENFDSVKDTVVKMKETLKDFTKGIAQSDDTTMLIFRYNNKNKNSYKSKATLEGYKKFRAWINNFYEEWNLNEAIRNKLDVISEEIFINIVSYGYKDKVGDVEVEFSRIDNTVTFRFIDDGIEYNPLAKEDPDVDLAPDDRPVGGLGIFMVKQFADECFYEYIEDKNVLTIKVRC